jgi:hypothetical protein
MAELWLLEALSVKMVFGTTIRPIAGLPLTPLDATPRPGVMVMGMWWQEPSKYRKYRTLVEN